MSESPPKPDNNIQQLAVVDFDSTKATSSSSSSSSNEPTVTTLMTTTRYAAAIQLMQDPKSNMTNRRPKIIHSSPSAAAAGITSYVNATFSASTAPSIEDVNSGRIQETTIDAAASHRMSSDLPHLTGSGKKKGGGRRERGKDDKVGGGGGMKDAGLTEKKKKKKSVWRMNTFRLLVMLTMTLSFFFVEIIFGYISNSMALIADSFHMLSDVLALCIAFFCMKISRRKSRGNTFGWIRAEVLGALINAVFLLALCFSIFIEAITRLIKAAPVKNPKNVLIVGAIGLAVNVIGIFMFHGHASVSGHSHARPVSLTTEQDVVDMENVHYQLVSKEAHSISVLNNDEGAEDHINSAVRLPSKNINHAFHNGKKAAANGKQQAKEPLVADGHGQSRSGGSNHLNMHGVFLHILGDALGSIIVIFNALIVWQWKNEYVAKYLDPSLSLIMVVIISCTTIPLLKESALILLQTVPPHLNSHNIREKMLKIDGIETVHDFHVWRLAGNKIIATAHIQCRNRVDYMLLATAVKAFFHNEGIHSTTIQPEFIQGSVDSSAISSLTYSSPDDISGGQTTPPACVLVCPNEKLPSELQCDNDNVCCSLPPPRSSNRPREADVQESSVNEEEASSSSLNNEETQSPKQNKLPSEQDS